MISYFVMNQPIRVFYCKMNMMLMLARKKEEMGGSNFKEAFAMRSTILIAIFCPLYNSL